MPRSTRWSSASASCRPEPVRIAWRPSRWVTGALFVLSLIAPFAVLASDMPRIAAWPLAGFAGIAGLRGAWRERRRAPRLLELLPGAGRAALDAVPLVEAALSWRGPLAFLRWRDAAGGAGRLSWWPDTLPPAERRVLRLWSSGGADMAP